MNIIFSRSAFIFLGEFFKKKHLRQFTKFQNKNKENFRLVTLFLKKFYNSLTQIIISEKPIPNYNFHSDKKRTLSFVRFGSLAIFNGFPGRNRYVLVQKRSSWKSLRNLFEEYKTHRFYQFYICIFSQ